MKLAIVTAYPPSKVTLNEYAFHLVKHFRQKEEITEIVLLTDRTQGEKNLSFTENGCKITIKECWSFNSYRTLYSVSNAIKNTQPDAVLFNLQFMKFGDKKIPATLGLLLPLVCKLRKIPTIALLHNILEEVDLGSAGFTSNKVLQKAYNFIGSMITRLILQADVVAVTMQKYVTILEEKYKVSNVQCIPHGTFEVSNEAPDYTVPKGPLQIMTFGKFGTYKKVEPLIEAVELIRESSDLDLEVVVAGTDNPNVPGYLANVQEKYKHIKQVRFTGYVEEEEVPTLFKDSAVVVFPYTATTGSSGVLHQAGSYGKAVVLPDLGDLALLIKDEGYQGEFFNPEHTQSLATAIEKIITNDTYRKQLGEANYKASIAFPMERITDMYLDTFKTIIQRKKQIRNTNEAPSII
ncbi:glycosyltransferase [uncultured Dokdonia sp.]|uniref:glycosyltransferase n=1 Tax=uncultured Dokdonia sp. TaxID=575653 RepID=UPI0026194118|nr:glycosyltransferase [uncultured Dokdonia sp.]